MNVFCKNANIKITWYTWSVLPSVIPKQDIGYEKIPKVVEKSSTDSFLMRSSIEIFP